MGNVGIVHSVFLWYYIYNMASVINKNTLDRISNIFPCVIWKDYSARNGKFVCIDEKKKISKKDKGSASGYFDKNTDTDFHQCLNEIVSVGKTDYDIVVSFYNFKNTPKLAKSKQKIFDYLLPPEEEFFQINNDQYSVAIGKNGIYSYFNQYYIEERFDTELASIISINLEPGKDFPLYNKGSILLSN